MTKTMKIEGMSCGHCTAAVEKALKAVAGVADAKVDLDAKTAAVTLSGQVADDVLTAAVAEAGYQVVGVQ